MVEIGPGVTILTCVIEFDYGLWVSGFQTGLADLPIGSLRGIICVPLPGRVHEGPRQDCSRLPSAGPFCATEAPPLRRTYN